MRGKGQHQGSEGSGEEDFLRSREGARTAGSRPDQDRQFTKPETPTACDCPKTAPCLSGQGERCGSLSDPKTGRGLRPGSGEPAVNMLPSAFRTWNWKTGLLAVLGRLWATPNPTGVQLGPLGVPRPSVRVCPAPGGACLPGKQQVSPAGGSCPSPCLQTGYLGLCHVSPKLSTTERGTRCLTTENRGGPESGWGSAALLSVVLCSVFRGRLF